MTLLHSLALSGLALTLAGSWCVAFEVVNRFNGYAFEIRSMTYRGQGKSEKTEEFKKWEAKRSIVMCLGLGCITLGSFMQMAAVYLDS